MRCNDKMAAVCPRRSWKLKGLMILCIAGPVIPFLYGLCALEDSLGLDSNWWGVAIGNALIVGLFGGLMTMLFNRVWAGWMRR